MFELGAGVIEWFVVVVVETVEVVAESVLPKFAAAPRSMVLEGFASVLVTLDTVKEFSSKESLSFSSEASSPSSPLLQK